MCIAGCSIEVSNTLKTLRVKANSMLTFVNHVNDIVRACKFTCMLCVTFVVSYFVMWQTLSPAVSSAHTLTIATRSYFARMKVYLTNYSKLKTVRLACHWTSWVPVRRRITYKGATLCFKRHQSVGSLGSAWYISNSIRPSTRASLVWSWCSRFTSIQLVCSSRTSRHICSVKTLAD